MSFFSLDVVAEVNYNPFVVSKYIGNPSEGNKFPPFRKIKEKIINCKAKIAYHIGKRWPTWNIMKKETNKSSYLSIGGTGNNASIISIWHDFCLKDIVMMTWMEWKRNFPSFPGPEYDPSVIRTWYDYITISIEANRIHTAPVLLQLPEYIKPEHKILV